MWAAQPAAAAEGVARHRSATHGAFDYQRMTSEAFDDGEQDDADTDAASSPAGASRPQLRSSSDCMAAASNSVVGGETPSVRPRAATATAVGLTSASSKPQPGLPHSRSAGALWPPNNKPAPRASAEVTRPASSASVKPPAAAVTLIDDDPW